MEQDKRINMSAAAVAALEDLRLNLTHFWLIELFYFGDTTVYSKAAYQTLERKELIVNGILTQEGKQLYESLITLTDEKASSLKESIELVQSEKETQFDEWYKAYPSGTTWVDKGNKKWFGGRNLKGQKEKCRKLYLTILAEGKYTHEQMIAAIEYEVALRKRQSILNGQNKMNYMNNTYTYLYQGKYEGFIEMMLADTKREDVKEQPQSNTFLL